MKSNYFIFFYIVIVFTFIFSKTEDIQFPIVIEGEDLLEDSGQKAQLYTNLKDKEFPGYTGKGFAYLTSSPLSFEIDIPEETLYDIRVRLFQIMTEPNRRQTLLVNNKEYVKNVPFTEEWVDFSFGFIRLKKGVNKLSFIMRSGYMGIDSVTVDIPEYPDFKEASSEPCDKKATKEVKNVMKYLHSIYGEHILSGQQQVYGGGHKENYEYEFDFLLDLTGKLPAIRGFDIANYNNMYGWNDGNWERMEAWWEKGGLITTCYHLTLPSDWENYELGTKITWSESSVTKRPLPAFSVKNIVVEGTKENEFLNANIKIIAEKFLSLQEKGIPVIFRPFHEAEGNLGIGNAWFWWGQEGPEPFKELWKYFYNQLTENYGIHNIIWELNLYCWNESSADWYPGDDYVDIVGYDKYNVMHNRHDGKNSGPNVEAESGLFYGLVNEVKNKKMVSMPENDSIPSLENMKIENTPWLYFCTWYDNEGDSNYVTSDKFNDPELLKEIYQSDFCITLDELPDFKN